MKKQQTVWVKNNGTEQFVSRYDGEDFEIAPGEAVEMLIECAQLCIGFGDEDKSRCLRRLGWAFSLEAMPAAAKRLEAFSFHMEKPGSASKESSSSAPRGNESPVVASVSAGQVVYSSTGRKLGPLDKLAAANLPAAG